MSPTVLLIVTAIVPCAAMLLRALGWYVLVWLVVKREPKRAAQILDAARPRGVWQSIGRGG